MTGWPPWRRAEPAQLWRYVHTGVLAKVLRPELRLPGRSGAPPEVRVRQLFEAFAAGGVRYADEQPVGAGEQDIRTPDQVFVRPGLGNCLDLVVAFAGGCLDAGLHPMIVTLSPAGPGRAAHAIVVIWLRGDLDGAVPYPLAEAVHDAPLRWPGMGLRSSWDTPGEFVAVDVAQAAHGWPPGGGRAGFDEAVTAGAGMLTAATFDPSDLSKVPFPSWATTPIPEAVLNLASGWIAADWPQRQQILTAPDMPTDRDLLRVLCAVYCDRPELQQWLDVVDDIDARGRDVVFAEMDAAHATVSLLQAWITTPSWNASQAFLAGHPALRGLKAVATLEQWSGDNVARQHLAILRLTEHVPAGGVFDAILDPTDARQLLLRVARTGSAALTAETWYATPHIAADPFTATLAAALVEALSDEPDYPDEIDQALRAAAEAASTSERRDTLTLLRTLATTRDDRAEQLHRIASSITPTGERSH